MAGRVGDPAILPVITFVSRLENAGARPASFGKGA
jgi:hypothetical protein